MSMIQTTESYAVEDIVKAVLEIQKQDLFLETSDRQAEEKTGKSYKDFKDCPDILQARHVSEVLGISETKAYEVLHSKKCPSFTIGTRIMVGKQEFADFLQANKGQDLIE